LDPGPPIPDRGRTVWRGEQIDDGSLTKVVSVLRTALDPNDPNRYIVTDKGRGYRFVEPVTRVEDPRA